MRTPRSAAVWARVSGSGDSLFSPSVSSTITADLYVPLGTGVGEGVGVCLFFVPAVRETLEGGGFVAPRGRGGGGGGGGLVRVGGRWGGGGFGGEIRGFERGFYAMGEGADKGRAPLHTPIFQI